MLPEILLVGQRLYTQNFKVLETLLAVAVYYVFLVTVFDQLRGFLERHLDVQRKGRRKGVLSTTGSLALSKASPPVTADRERRPHSGDQDLR